MSTTLLFVVAPLLVIAFVIVKIALRGLQFKRLLTDGVESWGTVIRKIRFGSGRPQFYIRYEYRDRTGGSHSHKSLVTRDVWETLEVGKPIAILYSASKPSVSAPLYLIQQARSAFRK